jgi:hypothetical protein
MEVEGKGKRNPPLTAARRPKWRRSLLVLLAIQLPVPVHCVGPQQAGSLLSSGRAVMPQAVNWRRR